MRQVHNWEELKREFLASPHLEVTPFLREKNLLDDGEKPGGNAGDRTLGWAKEKQAIEAKATAKATDKLISKLALTKIELTDAKWAVIRTAIQMLQLKKTRKVVNPDGTKQDIQVADVEASDLEKIWKMIKTENDEPTVINKNQHSFPDPVTKVEIEIVANYDPSPPGD